MLLVEIGEAIVRQQLNDLSLKNEYIKTKLDMLEELREKAKIKEEVCKQRAAHRYNAKVRSRNIQKGDLVWQITGNARKDPVDGKFEPNWE